MSLGIHGFDPNASRQHPPGKPRSGGRSKVVFVKPVSNTTNEFTRTPICRPIRGWLATELKKWSLPYRSRGLRHRAKIQNRSAVLSVDHFSKMESAILNHIELYTTIQTSTTLSFHYKSLAIAALRRKNLARWREPRVMRN